MKNKTLHYGLIQSSYWLSYLPLFAYAATFLLNVGYSNTSIGLLLALANLSSIAVQSFLAQRIDSGKLAMKTVMLVQGLLILAMSFLIHLKPLLAFYYIMLVSLMSLQPFVNALSISCLQQGIKLDFGLARGLASLVYSLSSFGLGALMVKRGVAISPLAGMLFIFLHLLTLISFGFPDKRINLEDKTKKKGVFARYPFLPLFLISVVLTFFGYNMFHNYLVHLIRYLDGSEQSLGLAIGISAFAEVPIMFLFTRISRRFPVKNLLRLSAAFFLIKALMDLFSTNIYSIYLNQLTNALTFGLFMPASIYFLSKAMDQQDTAKGQALLTSAIIAGNVLASLVGGLVMDLQGIRFLLALVAVIEVFALVLMLFSLSKEV